MPSVIIPQKDPLTGVQIGQVQTLLASPGYSLLRSIISAKLSLAQIAAIEARMYPSNPDAKLKAEDLEEKAQALNSALDVLDDLGSKPDEWFTVRLEQRR